MKRIFNLVNSFQRLAHWRLRPAENDYEVEYCPGTVHTVADGLSRLRRCEEEQNLIDEKVPCFVIESSQGTGAVQPGYREAVIVFWGSTQAEPTLSSTVLSVDEGTVRPDSSTLEEFSKALNVDGFCRKCTESEGDPQSYLD